MFVHHLKDLKISTTDPITMAGTKDHEDLPDAPEYDAENAGDVEIDDDDDEPLDFTRENNAKIVQVYLQTVTNGNIHNS